jgi:type IV pilus assembly protein PilP
MTIAPEQTRIVGSVRRSKIVVAHCVLALSVVLSGCSSSSMTDLMEYVDSVKAKPAGRIAPLPEFKTYETYAYSSSSLRDPFVMFEDEAEIVQPSATPGGGLRPDLSRHKETLEQYPLDTLKFVGQLEKDGNKWAIVTSPDSLVHRVKVGNHIGKNYGKITAVMEDKIIIRELVPDGMGGWIEREAGLSLRTE